MKSMWKKLLIWGCVLLLLGGAGVPVYAEKERETIRVAYYPTEGFLEEDDKGEVSGFGKDLLEKISARLAVNFSYVRANSYEDTKLLLENGKADITMPVTYSDSYSDEFYIGYVSFMETYHALIAKKTRDDLLYEDAKKIKTLKVGITRALYDAPGMRKYLGEMGIVSRNLHIFETRKASLTELNKENVDAVIIDMKGVTSQYKLLKRFGYTGNYIASLKEYEYARKIEDALGQIKIDEPEYLKNLFDTYYGRFEQIPLTKDEEDYIKKLKRIVFGVSGTQGFYSRKNEFGENSGIYPAVAKGICQRLGIQCEIRSVSHAQFDEWTGFRRHVDEDFFGAKPLGEIDVWTDCVDKEEVVKKRDVFLSKHTFYHEYYLITRKGESVDTRKDRCALIRGYAASESIRRILANKNIVWCNTYEECMARVRQKKADFSLIDTLAVEYYLPYYKNSNLGTVLVNYQTESHMATKDGRLASILSKVIEEMQEDGTLEEIINEEMLQAPKQNGFIGALYNDPEQSINYMLMVMSLLFVIAVLLIVVFRIRKQNETLEKISAAKTDFMSRMSHDIKTPMNAVLGMTHLAKQEKDVSPRIVEYLDKIEGAGEYLLGLINDILDMTKLRSGTVVFKDEAVDICEVKDSLCEMFADQYRAKGITLSFDFSEVRDPYVMMDRMRVKQIFSNLISNALKFSPKDSTVSWKCTTERIGGDKVRITNVISDEGCGMSEAFLKKLFEPFEQEENAMSCVENGTGLGLAIVKNLVEQMQGTIDVKSKLGEGTSFTIIFTRDRAEEDVREKKDGSVEVDTSLANVHVLVAEDQPLNQEIIRGLLQKRNMKVTLVSNGKEALEFMQSEEGKDITVILMDIRMPVMDGMEAARRIRNLDGDYAKKVPIIALTANALPEDREATRQAGMNGYIAKPIHPAELFDTLEKNCVRS